jgi:hypothetical protein
MQHFSQVRKEAQILLTASQQEHPEAWAKFSARVHSPPSMPSRAPREIWPVRGLFRKRRRIESEEESRKRAKWEEPRREEEEELSEEGDGVTEIPESEYEAVTDSDGCDTIPESEYEEFTDSEEHDIRESVFDDEVGHEGGRGQDGGEQFESGSLRMMLEEDEDEKGEMVYL